MLPPLSTFLPANIEENPMKSGRTLGFALSMLLLIGAVPSLASDTAKEKRWADQIVDGLIDGEAVWLQAGSTKFLGIYTESAKKPAKGAVIVLHGTGVHPDWADVVNPLRVHLTEYGWNTLSLQMPILRNEAEEPEYAPLFPEIAPRMQAGIDFLKSKGNQNIGIAAHSLGATMAAYYMANNANPVKGMVVIGTSGVNFNVPNLRYFETLPKLNKLPILDLYGSEDTKAVLETVSKRADIAKKSGNTHYVQVKVPGANHFFQGKDKELVQEVSSWLDKNITR
jgi:pimeloyl-ACP methyl ester carboxylesterase